MFLSQIEKFFPDFNKKSHTERDAIEFCKKHKVYICDDPKTAYGKYIHRKGYDFILLNPKMDQKMRLWVLWHEIGHYLFHAPETSFFSSQMKRKNDAEANNFAAVAMMPKSLIKKKTLNELKEEFPFDLILIRKKIFDCEDL